MDSVTVAVACDRRYVRHAAAVALSLFEVDPGATVHLLHAEDLTGDDLYRFRAVPGGVTHTHLVRRERVAGLPTVDLFGPVMWYRILLPELLPDVTRVLYLDADTWVRRSLVPLFERKLGPSGCGAVDNVLAPDQERRVREDLGLGDYFNSGVLLLDLDRLRDDGGMTRVVEVARARADDIMWPDQDALNLVFANRRDHLDHAWNVQNSFWSWRDRATEVLGVDVVDRATAAPGIVHFEGPGMKPWFRDCQHPLVDGYRELAARTPWGPLELQDPLFPPVGPLRRGLRRLRRRR